MGATPATVALALAVTAGSPAWSAAAPKPLEPRRVIKPAGGYFDETFAIDPTGQRVAVIRTDGATFAKVEVVDLATGATGLSFDLPREALDIERLELLPGAQGILVISSGPSGGPEDAPKRSASLFDAQGRLARTVGPANDFGRPPPPPVEKPGTAAPALLVAFDRKSGAAGTTTYTLTPYELGTLAPVGKPRVYRTGSTGEILSSSLPTLRGSRTFRIQGFFDGYARAVGERPEAFDKKSDTRTPAGTAVLDLLGGQLSDAQPISDVDSWIQAARLRADHPDRTRFAALNQDQSGVDIVDAMGKRQAAELAIPFRLYEPKSLRDQEGPEPGAFYFSLSIDPLNADAVKRRKPDLPMLDLYAAERGAAASPRVPIQWKGRVFVPRPVTWRAGHGKLVVLKRFKAFTRGGNELQIFDVR